MKKAIVLLSILLVVLAAAVVYVYLRPAKALRRPHIVLIVVDTLRADHLGCYGYARPTSPNMDAAAARGTVFEHAFAPSSWTVPSMATVFTGLPPQRHGVTQGLQFFGQVVFQHQLSEKFDTLAERLKHAGYETFGYSANSHVTLQTGFGQGFTSFQSLSMANSEQVERLVNSDIEKMRDLDAQGQPYFLFLHFVDPHVPYLVREPFDKAVAPDFDRQAFMSINPDGGDLVLGVPKGYFKDHPKPLQSLVDAYDTEIAAADASIGRILSILPGADRAEVMIMSDHGEEFYEHEMMMHGYDLFQETVRVPIILRGPIGKTAPPPKRTAAAVSLIDVMPTLLRIAGASAADLPGVDLTGEIPEKRTFPLFLQRGPIEHHGAIIYPESLTVDRAADKKWYFDLAADPAEKTNLLPGKTPPAELEKAAADAWTVDPIYPAILIQNPSVSSVEQLKSLGYLTGGPAEPKAPEPTVSRDEMDSRTVLTAVKPEQKAPWVVELGICPEVRAIDKDCAKKPPTQKDSCVADRLSQLKAKTCSKASSFNYRKKCEFMRLEQTLRKCSEVEAAKAE